MALSNLKRNRRMVGPYFVATAILSGMFFIILNLIDSQSISNIIYGPTLQAMLSIGINVMTFFTVIYMLYINSFLIKRRKTEFGLYGVLGLEKRHVGRIIFWENLILSGAGLAFGLLSGAVFGKLVFLILMRALRTAPGSTFSPSVSAMAETATIFLVIFLLTCLYNVFQVRLASPIDLLRGEKKGEKQPRFVLPLTLVGVVTLGGGYALSILSRLPTVALVAFWPAVILVIIGTLCLFTSGSIFLLRRLRKNKQFYYRPRNFVAVSGLMHRMKQNAAGLANICILSTMVIITMTGCCSLFFGQEAILRESNPYDFMTSVSMEDRESRSRAVDETLAAAQEYAAQYGAEMSDVTRIVWYRTQIWDSTGASRSAQFVPVEQYNALTGSQYLLAPDELLFIGGSEGTVQHFNEKLNGRFSIQRDETAPALPIAKGLLPEDSVVILVADEDALVSILRVYYEAEQGDDLSDIVDESLYFNLDLPQEEGAAYSDKLAQRFSDIAAAQAGGGAYGTSWSSIFSDRASQMGTYGGLLFLGIFFTILFLTNTVIIIYFKQVSEGMEDRERFAIMQKVGMSDEEVKKAINRQVLIVFFLPLAAALLHTLAASNIMVRLLELFWLYDTSITLLCMGITGLCFALVYVVVYSFTARTYYKIVKW